MVFFSEKDIQAHVDYQTFLWGANYQEIGQVSHLSVTVVSNCYLIEAKVQGKRKRPYTVSIEVDNEDNLTTIEGECSCPMGYDCKHVVAVLLEALKHPAGKKQTMGETNKLSNRNPKTTSKATPFTDWFNHLHEAFTPTPILPTIKDDKTRLLYLLNLSSGKTPSLILNLVVARVLKKGGYGLSKLFSPSLHGHYAALLAIDHDILHQLEIVERSAHPSYRNIYQNHYQLKPELSAVFKTILKTERCYWQTHIEAMSLRLGETKKGNWQWNLEDDGQQRLICTVEGQEITVLPLTPLWYIHHATALCGLLETEFPLELNRRLLAAPPLLPEETKTVSLMLKEQLSTKTNPLPQPHQLKILKSKPIQPKAKLVLFGAPLHPHFLKDFGIEEKLPLGRLSFLYENKEVPLDAHQQFRVLERDQHLLKTYQRDFTLERAHINLLLQKGAHNFSKYYPNAISGTIKPQDFLIGRVGIEATQRAFLDQSVAELKMLGWEVIIDASFPVEQLLNTDEWYSELHETSDYQWFNIELGFVLNEQKINILPLLVELIQENPHAFAEKQLSKSASQDFIITLKNGQKIQIPSPRIQGILATLAELYQDKSLNKLGQLSVSRLRAAQLLNAEKTLRWFGAEQLQQLSQQLASFESIQSVPIPKTFKGALRDYQKQGVNWLGFLREYQLGGILSDDMGLGKTVQALAHILVEKTAKRITKPCLIVAPTSLMSNWQREANQFTPSLKVVVLHGQFRKQLFEQLQKADIILTTYALVLQDKDVLLSNQYDLIILDEAQYIKNANTKTYQILQQLSATHRLCLTGTPMENHLGELWSLFNFLSPGLLGTMKQFSQIFRNPIEKQGDVTRQQNLNQRLHPYMLRRTKEAVLQELPPKTEVIHHIELANAQRDLYESIRLSMEGKLKKVIHEKGVSTSQILILDALLKLRQVCCDPRLLPLAQAKKVQESAKLTFLINMLGQLIEEGRKILLFSSFSSMLTLIAEELKKHHILFVKLTGKTRDRETPIRQFQEERTPVFLISLKAGGTGLNLTAADTVIHYDPWWNPAAEAQATDRAHRMGQTKPVFVYKLVTVGTVEEKILIMQQKKRQLWEGLFTANKINKPGITKEDLNFLLTPLDAV
jgi:superfamily II DNA or RNA helicase